MSEGYPRETQELVLFGAVTVNGVTTTDFTYQLQRDGERPTATWLTPVVVGSDRGFMLQPVATRGTWNVWVRIAQSGQEIVEQAGEVERT